MLTSELVYSVLRENFPDYFPKIFMQCEIVLNKDRDAHIDLLTSTCDIGQVEKESDVNSKLFHEILQGSINEE